MKLNLQKTKYTIKDLLYNQDDLTFLAGSGCSVESPSNILTADELFDGLIQTYCEKSDIQKILKIKNKNYDFGSYLHYLFEEKEISRKILDFFSLCESPNVIHYFLANMIAMGHTILTTNFDSLIEKACLEYNISAEKITVSTKEDFKDMAKPSNNSNQNQKRIFKLNGSVKKGINQENVDDHIDFNITDSKLQVFKNLTKERTVVIIGYSGENYNNIRGLLRGLKNIKKLIWLHQSSDMDKKTEVYEIKSPKKEYNYLKMNQMEKLLNEIRNNNKSAQILYINGNISEILNEINYERPEIFHQPFSLSWIDWLKNIPPVKNEFLRFLLPFNIYLYSKNYTKALKCAQNALKYVEKTQNQVWKAKALLLNARYYLEHKKDYLKALNYINLGIEILEQTNELRLSAKFLTMLRNTYYSQGSISLFYKIVQKELEIWKKLKKPREIRYCIITIGKYYQMKGKKNEAKKKYEEALKIAETLEDPTLKINSWAHIANVTPKKGLIINQKILKIAQDMGAIKDQATILNNIANIKSKEGKFNEALKLLAQGQKLHELTENKAGIGIIQNNIGNMYTDRKKYSQALIYTKKSLKISKKLNDHIGTLTTLHNLAYNYLYLKNNNKAKKCEIEALKIAASIGANDYYLIPTIKNSLRNLNRTASRSNRTGYYNSGRYNYDSHRQFQENAQRAHMQALRAHFQGSPNLPGQP